MSNLLTNLPFRIVLLIIGAIFILVGLSGGIKIGPYGLMIQDIWARIALSILGIIQLLMAIYLEIRGKSSTGIQSEERISNSNDGITSLPYDKFSKISEQEFLAKVDLSKVSKLIVLGHTGRKLYEVVHEQLQEIINRGETFPEEIQILIRAPLVEGLYRNNYIQSTITKIKTLREQKRNIDVRFYESIPSVRGMICELKTKERFSYISSYHWHQQNKSKASDVACITKDSREAPKPETAIFESWAEQYWGKDEIHTVVFDFDDTLVFTGAIQVQAWAQAIARSLEHGIITASDLSPKFRDIIKSDPNLTSPELQETITKIFVNKQLAEAIGQEIFPKVGEETLKKINECRFGIRERLMENVQFFEGVESMLNRLYQHYNLAIISSTDELLISDFLTTKGLIKYFPIILGKRDPSLRSERENIYHKASLLIKLSEIIGMPLSRLVYIGDNNFDYLATRQLGIAFIEARPAAKHMQRQSMISKIDKDKPPLGYFESFKNNQLLDLLREHSGNLTKSKYQI